MAEDIYQVWISPTIKAKINNARHRMTEDDVLWVCGHPLSQGWNFDPERGWRLYIEGKTESGAPAIVVLYPTREHGLWNLGTARRA